MIVSKLQFQTRKKEKNVIEDAKGEQEDAKGKLEDAKGEQEDIVNL